MFGLTLLAVFGFTAIFAPNLTQVDPLSQQASGAAAPFVPPAWYRLFNPSLSENTLEFSSHFSSNSEGWAIATNSTIPSGSNITASADYDAAIGYVNRHNPSDTDPGSLRVSFVDSNSTVGLPSTEVYIEKQFTYDYISAAGIKYGLDYRVSAQANQTFDPIMDVRIVDTFGRQHSLGFGIPQLLNTHGSWRDVPLDTAPGGFDPILLSSTFSRVGEYKMLITLTFLPLPPGSWVNYTVWFDKISLFTYGQAYGFMGSDSQGKDVWSFLIWGTRVSFLVGLLATGVSVGIGLLIGLSSGYIGGLGDELIMRGTDFFLVLPGLPLLIVLAAILGPSIWNIILTISVISWPGVARVIRSQTLTVKERMFVESARAIGASSPHILLKHILPNVLGLVFALAASSVGGAIVFEAALSFLGLGDPRVPSWGQILNNANAFGAGAEVWWMVVPPGLAIGLISVSFIFMGHALDEIVNPKLRAR